MRGIWDSLRPWLPVLAVPVLLLLSYSSVTVTGSELDPEVMIECDGSTRTEPGDCGEWGDAILAEGQPAGENNWVVEDVTRLRVERALWGYMDRCTAKYYVYNDDAPVYDTEVDCR